MGNADFDRARAMLADKREDEALDWFELASERSDDAAARASASAHVAALLLGFRRPWEVAEFTGRMRRDGGDAALADVLDASACIQLGDAVGALQLLGEHGPIAAPSDPWYPCSEFGALATRIRALHLAARDPEAVVELHRALDRSPSEPPLWAAVATLVADGVLAADDALRHLRSTDVTALFGWIAGAPDEAIDAIAEAIWSWREGDPGVLAAATLFGWRLGVEGALRWSVRLRTAGLSDRSPVHERAEHAGVPPTERVEAAIAAAPLDTARARAALATAIGLVADDDLLPLFDLCVEQAGAMVDTFVVAAATNTERCLLLASELALRGSVDEGFAVLVAGLSLPTADELTPDSFARLVPIRERDALAGVALRRGDLEVAGILASVATSSPLGCEAAQHENRNGK